MSWRDSGRRVKLYMFDAYLTVFFVLLFVSWSLYMLGLVVVALVFFYVLEYKGYTLPNALRRIRITIAGRNKKGKHWFRNRTST